MSTNSVYALQNVTLTAPFFDYEGEVNLFGHYQSEFTQNNYREIERVKTLDGGVYFRKGSEKFATNNFTLFLKIPAFIKEKDNLRRLYHFVRRHNFCYLSSTIGFYYCAIRRTQYDNIVLESQEMIAEYEGEFEQPIILGKIAKSRQIGKLKIGFGVIG